MSCITEILKIKGDKEFLAVGEGREPWVVVEGGGTYDGYEYLITFTPRGHRCGYVAIPPEHKYNGTPLEYYEFAGKKRERYDYDSLNINCHGGITFMKRDHGLKDLLATPCTDFWVGFDCAHANDGKDLKLVEKYFGRDAEQLKFYREHPEYICNHPYDLVRSYDYVENECKDIINQLKEAA